VNLLSYYKETFSTTRRWIWFSSLVFLSAIVAGFLVFYADQNLIQEIFSFFQKLLQSSSSSDQNLVLVIFKQNLSSSLLALLGGILFGIAPFFIVVANGFIIGYVVHFLFRILPVSLGSKLLILVVTLLPHGIFELPIVLVSAALGMQWGLQWLMPSSRGLRKQVWRQNAKMALVFIPLLVLVLLLAAFIEVYVSGKLAALYAGRIAG
jgi:stage II sporulation protein M